MTISVWSPGEQINNSLTMTGIGSRKKKKNAKEVFNGLGGLVWEENEVTRFESQKY